MEGKDIAHHRENSVLSGSMVLFGVGRQEVLTAELKRL